MLSIKHITTVLLRNVAELNTFRCRRFAESMLACDDDTHCRRYIYNSVEDHVQCVHGWQIAVTHSADLSTNVSMWSICKKRAGM